MKTKKVAKKALDAFFSVVSQEYPEIKTGDLSPMDTDTFENYAIKMVNTWLISNQKG
jgi:hypothetical protein